MFKKLYLFGLHFLRLQMYQEEPMKGLQVWGIEFSPPIEHLFVKLALAVQSAN